MARPLKSKIAVFIGLTFALSAPFYFLIHKAGAAHAYSAWLMWTPGIAALLTQLIHERSLSGLGWRIARFRCFAAAYLIPLGYVSVVYGLVWLTAAGAFKPGGFLEAMGGDLPFRLGSETWQTAAGIGYVITHGVLTTCWATLGGELGWRGLLVPELAKRHAFAMTALISGALWAAWHFPVLLFADYHNPGAPPWFGLVCFTIVVLGVSFAFAWLRLRSGSVWVPVLLQASHNVFIQDVFTPMTGPNAITPYVIDEFGIGLALAGVLVAWLFWRRRSAMDDNLNGKQFGWSSQPNRNPTCAPIVGPNLPPMCGSFSMWLLHFRQLSVVNILI
jgi:membrane protease YdiL (CAAX protease family)